MEIKDYILEELAKSKSEYLSGESVAEHLGVSRNAICKVIAQLRKDGFIIDSSPRKGYKFSKNNLRCPKAGITKYLTVPCPLIVSENAVSSTNVDLIRLSKEGAPEGTLLTAEEQTAGKGRTGKSFFSPRGTGIYMSILLHPAFSAANAKLITTCAAVAICHALKTVSDKEPSIKWVNDIFIGEKKVCGILTEGSYDLESDTLSKAVLGIGINLFPPENGFGMYTGIAGTVLKEQPYAWDIKGRVIASVYDNFMSMYRMLPDTGFIEEYKMRSFLPGRRITVVRSGVEKNAVAVKIGDDLRLLVKFGDGNEEWLDSGEVNIKTK